MKTFKKVLKWLGIVAIVFACVGGFVFFKYLYPFLQKMKETQVVQYDKNLTLVMGGSGNSGILQSDSLVMVIDTKMDNAAEALYKQAKQLAGKRPIFVVNTHIHPDHIGGNKYYTGSTILAGANYGKGLWLKEADEESLPTLWLKDRMDIKMGDDTVTLVNLGKNVHSESDVLVYLHKRKLLFGGDVVLNKQAPVLMGVANPYAYMEVLEALPKQFDIRWVVPGHGKMGGIEVISNFNDYFKDLREAANEPARRTGLLAKYDDWNQLPFFMSAEGTMNYFEKNKQ